MKLNRNFSLVTMIKLFTLFLFLLSTSVANADLYYSFEGEITEVTNKAIRLDDASYNFLATVKVVNLKGKSETVSNLKIGDFVKITILIIDNKRRVDTIQRIVKPDSSSYQQ